jgi:predicted lipoprotein with Yx(FWY)xxD motif
MLLLKKLVDSQTHHHKELIMRHPRIIIGGIGLAVVASVGGVTAAAAGSSPATSAPTAGHSVMAATVRTAPVTVAGKTETILVNAHGLPLYFYRPDTAAKSFVTGGLARLWPPLTSAAPTAAGAGGKVTVVNDAHGRQVAYNGHLLYTFISDHPGQVTGQGVQNFFVATPGLVPIAATAAPAGPAPAAPAGSYGY